MASRHARAAHKVVEGAQEIANGIVKVVSNSYRPVDEVIVEKLDALKTEIDLVKAASRVALSIDQTTIDAIANAILQRAQPGQEATHLHGAEPPNPAVHLNDGAEAVRDDEITEVEERKQDDQKQEEEDYQQVPADDDEEEEQANQGIADAQVQAGTTDNTTSTRRISTRLTKSNASSNKGFERASRPSWSLELLKENVKTAGGDGVDLGKDPMRPTKTKKPRPKRSEEDMIGVATGTPAPQSESEKYHPGTPNPTRPVQHSPQKERMMSTTPSISAGLTRKPTIGTTVTTPMPPASVQRPSQRGHNTSTTPSTPAILARKPTTGTMATTAMYPYPSRRPARSPPEHAPNYASASFTKTTPRAPARPTPPSGLMLGPSARQLGNRVADQLRPPRPQSKIGNQEGDATIDDRPPALTTYSSSSSRQRQGQAAQHVDQDETSVVSDATSSRLRKIRNKAGASLRLRSDSDDEVDSKELAGTRQQPTSRPAQKAESRSVKPQASMTPFVVSSDLSDDEYDDDGEAVQPVTEEPMPKRTKRKVVVDEDDDDEWSESPAKKARQGHDAQPSSQHEEIPPAAPGATMVPARVFATSIMQHGGMSSVKSMFARLKKG